jgi:hypothetical protein
MRNDMRMRVSRRSVVQGITFAAVATPMMLVKTQPAFAKLSQESAAYQDSAKGSQSCENCKLFVPPSSCTLVEGPISAGGWCKFWVAK